MPSVAYVLETFVGIGYVLGYVIRLLFWREQFSSTGLMPTGDMLAQIERSNKTRRLPSWFLVPSVLWLHHSDAFIFTMLLVGLFSGVAASLHYHNGLSIGICTFIYASLQAIHHLSFPVGGHRILTNVGALMFLCWLGSASDELMLALVRCTYVLIMFWSGVAKVYTDVGWRRLIHLDYHYWTQPLPTAIGYFFNSFPHWFHVASTFVSLFVEISCPLLAIWNPYTRLLSLIGCTGLVIMINSAGHFGYFGGPLYISSIAFFDDQAIAVLSQGVPSLQSLLLPDLHWWTVLSPTAKAVFLLYFTVSVYTTTARCWPNRLDAFLKSDAWYDQPLLSLLGSFLYSPYFFYWFSPKRRHEAVIEVRSGDGPWQEIHWRHGSGPLDRLCPPTFGLWETSTAFVPMRLNEAHEWRDGTPLYLRNFLRALRQGSPRFLPMLDPAPTKLPITEARLKIYDYRFVGQDMHKLWRLHAQLGGKMPATLPPQYIVGEHPGDYWKRELLQTHSLDEGKADV